MAHESNYFLSVARAIQLSGYSERTFRRFVASKEIKIVQINRKHFIMREELERWLRTKGKCLLYTQT